MGYRVAVAGASGAVGAEMLNILSERNFPVDRIHALASERSVGKEISFGEDETVVCENLADFDFSQADIGLFSPGGAVSAVQAPRAAEAGCVVIDNTSHFRMDPAVPLVVPEVNPHALEGLRERNIIANPNCSTIAMVLALKPLHDLAPIKRVVVSTYQSVAGAGKAGMDELYDQTKGIFQIENKEPHVFSKPIAFNVIPAIDKAMDDGSFKEEWKMAVETKKILDQGIEVFATCVRVPVFVGHAEAVNVEFHEPVDLEEAREAIRDFEGLALVDRPEEHEYVTPKECVGEFATFVSRMRIDPTVPHGLGLWVVSDNLRKGAALNAVQIAEEMIEQGLI